MHNSHTDTDQLCAVPACQSINNKCVQILQSSSVTAHKVPSGAESGEAERKQNLIIMYNNDAAARYGVAG